MIRVLCVVPHLYGSMRLLANTLRFLERQRFTVKLFVLSPRLTLKDEFPPDIGMRVFSGETSLLQRTLILRALLEEASGYDVLISYSELTTTYLTALAGLMNRKPVIGWVHTSLSQVFKLKLRPHKAHRIFLSLFYPRLAEVIAVSEPLSENLKSSFGWKNVTCIRNCIDVKWVQRAASTDLPPSMSRVFDRPVLINVAGLSYEKGQELLITAHHRLLDEGFQHNLLLVGEGPLRKHLESLVKRLRVESSVYFAGFLKNPYPLIARSKGLVLSSRFEGFGLVLVEALALGVPVIASDCDCGPREILNDGQDGLLVPPEDSEALAIAMKRILTDEPLSLQLRQRGLQRAWHYDCAKVVPALESLLNSVVRGRP